MKRFFLCLLVLSIIVSLSIPAFAAQTWVSYTQEEINAINEVNVTKYTMSFISTICDDADLQAGNIFTLYSENDNISGYCVDIINSGFPNGYVIVKFSDNNPVVSEFALGAGIENPYMAIMEKSNIEDEDTVFYSIGSNNYQVLDVKQDVVICDNFEILSKKEFKVYKEQIQQENRYDLATSSNYDGGIDYSDLDGWSVVSDNYEGSVKDNEEKTISGAENITWYCSADVGNNNRCYACSVVALCNLMKYYRSRGFYSISSTFTTLYDTLWNYAETNSEGSTTNTKIAPAASKYLRGLGYNCTYNGYLFDTFGDFKADLSKDKPCIFSYGAKFGDSKGGHTVLAVGYVNTTKYQYLQIADGWNNYLRYINFNGYDYTRKDGWTFEVSR